MAVENFGEVSEYLKTNAEAPEVKTYLDSFKVTPTLEVFKGLTNTDGEYKSFMDSERDKHSAKSLETWKTNNLSKLIDDKVKELYPQADPKDIELNKLKAEFEAMKQDGTRKDLTNKALKIAQEKKLPISLIDYFVGADEVTTTKNLEALESVFAAQVEALVTERLKGTSYTPPLVGGATTTTYTLDQIAKMTPEEINANWAAISKSMKTN